MARTKDRTKAPQSPPQEATSLNEDTTTGEQLDLLDVGPENSKEIVKQAKHYKTALSRRIEALQEEVTAKEKLKALIKEANLKPMDDGKIRVHVNGYTITVTPRDELIQVKEDEQQE